MLIAMQYLEDNPQHDYEEEKSRETMRFDSEQKFEESGGNFLQI